MTVINTQLKEELCMEVERWKQGLLKLSNNKSSENMDPGDLVMLRRSNKLEPPQIGIVLDLTNHKRDAFIRRQSGYCLTTAVGNLIPVATSTVEGGPTSSKDSQRKLGSMANRAGREFTHFVSTSLADYGDLIEIKRFQETLEFIPGIGEPTWHA